MAKIPQEALELFAAVPACVFGTSTTDGQPNTSIVGMKKVIDDETLYLSDQFFLKTKENFLANPKVSVVWWGDGGAYQVHGTAEYVEDEELIAWANGAFESLGMPIKAKGGVKVAVEAVYTSAAGPNAGAQIA